MSALILAYTVSSGCLFDYLGFCVICFSIFFKMNVELTNMHKLEETDSRLSKTLDSNISMTAASNPAYVPDGEELPHKKVYKI